VLEMRKKHGFTLKYPNVQASAAAKNKHPYSGYHYKPAQRLLRARKPHRHSRQCHVFSTVEPVPRLEAALRVTQRCQLSATIMGQPATGGGTTVDMAKSGPTVIAATDARKQSSNRLQARVPS
jgi:hypothetical protein